MEQKEFTEFVMLKIINAFPQFEKYCIAKPGNISDIE